MNFISVLKRKIKNGGKICARNYDGLDQKASNRGVESGMILDKFCRWSQDNFRPKCQCEESEITPNLGAWATIRIKLAFIDTEVCHWSMVRIEDQESSSEYVKFKRSVDSQVEFEISSIMAKI